MRGCSPTIQLLPPPRHLALPLSSCASVLSCTPLYASVRLCTAFCARVVCVYTDVMRLSARDVLYCPVLCAAVCCVLYCPVLSGVCLFFCSVYCSVYCWLVLVPSVLVCAGWCVLLARILCLVC